MQSEIRNKKNESNNKVLSGHVIAITIFLIGLILFIISFFIKNETAKIILNLVAIVLAGYHVITEGIVDTIVMSVKSRRFKPNTHVLMTLAALGAIAINEYGEATLLILIFAGAHLLEEYAKDRSKREITNLLNLNPQTARLILSSGETKIVDINELKIGDQLLVLNGDQVPTDGIITVGDAVIDQASITGESIPVDKVVGDEVYGSTINGNRTFTMEVTKNSDETVFAKIIELVNQSQTNISKRATIIKKIEPIYVTIVLLVAPLFYLGSLLIFDLGTTESFYRTMVLLIATSPCALAATDIPATLSATSNLARQGVLVKGGNYLALLSEVKVLALDKTGTLTEGKPVVTDIYIIEDLANERKELYLDLIYSMEKQANHPLADAIIKYLKQQNELKVEVTNVIGSGLEAEYENNFYKIGKPNSFQNISLELVEQTELYEQNGKTVVYFGNQEDVYILIAIQDIAKESSRSAINYFNENNIKVVMITGDAKLTAQALAKDLNIDEVRSNVLPNEKSDIIKDLKTNYGVTAMIGDGINDAPALVAADIGIAMGGGTDIAIDVADAVLMKNDLNKLSYTHKLSKKLSKLIWQNIIFAMTVVLFLVTMNVFGIMQMGFAVLIHEGSTLLVVLNGLRLLKTIKME